MAKPTCNNNQEQNDSFSRILSDLSGQDLIELYSAMGRLNYAFKEYDKYAQCFESRIDELITLASIKLSQFMKRYPESEANENARQKEEKIFRGVCHVLLKVFKRPAGKRISRDTIRELITTFMPFFIEFRGNESYIYQMVNVVMAELFTISDKTSLLLALVGMLHDYVGSVSVSVSTCKTSHLNTYLELTVKFIWRVVKSFDEYSSQLNVDVILYELHLFLKSYPTTWWKVNKRDVQPLQTIQTLIYLMVGQKGESILSHFTLIENKHQSKLVYYVQKYLRRCENQQQANKNLNGTNANQNLTHAG